MDLDLLTNVKAVSGSSVCEIFVFQAAYLNDSLPFQLQIIPDHASS